MTLPLSKYKHYLNSNSYLQVERRHSCYDRSGRARQLSAMNINGLPDPENGGGGNGGGNQSNGGPASMVASILGKTTRSYGQVVISFFIKKVGKY